MLALPECTLYTVLCSIHACSWPSKLHAPADCLKTTCSSTQSCQCQPPWSSVAIHKPGSASLQLSQHYASFSGQNLAVPHARCQAACQGCSKLHTALQARNITPWPFWGCQKFHKNSNRYQLVPKPPVWECRSSGTWPGRAYLHRPLLLSTGVQVNIEGAGGRSWTQGHPLKSVKTDQVRADRPAAPADPGCHSSCCSATAAETSRKPHSPEGMQAAVDGPQRLCRRM